ncbi:sensor histidine kinase [Pedobacter sp. UYP24]
MFREKLEALSYAYYDLLIPKEQYEKDAKRIEQQRVNRLVHNLTSINAHNIQEIYNLVPQDLLTSDYQKQLDFIQSELRKNTKKAAIMFLRIAKHNIHMKSEFSIYKKLDREDAVMEFRNHPVQKVLMNVLHTFFTDFTNKGIYVKVGEFFGKVLIDYESIQVALYHLIENASKYTMPDSSIEILFQEKGMFIDVRFKMKSLYIGVEETDKIFTEGFSGKTAKESKLNGDGIGMWQINQMMKLNNGSIRVIAGEEITKIDDFVYSNNEFILRFQKPH